MHTYVRTYTPVRTAGATSVITLHVFPKATWSVYVGGFSHLTPLCMYVCVYSSVHSVSGVLWPTLVG